MKTSPTTEPVDPADAPIFEMPGVVGTSSRLIVFDGATDQQLHRVFAKFAKMEKTMGWWWGDIGIEMQERRRRQLLKEAAALRLRAKECSDDQDGKAAQRQFLERAEKIETRGVIEYTHELCELYDVAESTLRNNVLLARVFEPYSRKYGLKIEHYRVALLASGGVEGKPEERQKWLEKAQAEKLTAADLRKQANIARATFHNDPDPDPEPTDFEELIAADKWCLKHRPAVGKMSVEQVLRVFTLIQGVREYVDELQRRLNAAA